MHKGGVSQRILHRLGMAWLRADVGTATGRRQGKGAARQHVCRRRVHAGSLTKEEGTPARRYG